MTGTRALWPLAAGLLLLAGCGWMEWPPPSTKPRAAAVPAPSRPAASVIAASGDTVYEIARRHRVSMRAVIEANGLAPPYRLRAGQRLVLPRPRAHLVRRGDTLYGISRRYRVGMYALARANRLGPPYTILVGQRLRLPGAARLAPPPRPAKPAAAAPKAAAKTAKAAPQPKAVTPRPPPPAIPAPPSSSGKGFLWPVRGKVVSGFGPKAKGLHNDGVNIAAPRGSPVQGGGKRRHRLRRERAPGLRQPASGQARQRLDHGLCPHPGPGRQTGRKGEKGPGDRAGRQHRQREHAPAPLRAQAGQERRQSASII